MAIAVSIVAEGFELLAQRALEAAPSADWIELRLDHLACVDEAALADLIARLGRPVIAAAHGPEAYGGFSGTPAERRALLERAARAGASCIDMDWRLAREPWELPRATRRILSRHERTPRAPAAALARELRGEAGPGDWLKLVVEARTAQEGLDVLACLSDASGDLIAFASGEAATFTRVLAPILGSPLTYARASTSPATAPGQLTAAELREAWPNRVYGVRHHLNSWERVPRPATSIFAVLGRPIGHSISPRVHTRALREANLDAVFVALEVDDLAAALACCTAEPWRGFAVTAPHKQAAFALASTHDAASLRARACNTLVRDGGAWRGANTDVDGVLGALEKAAAGQSLRGARARVLGSGGAARAALVALERMGAEGSLASRNPVSARSLADEFHARAVDWSRRAEGPFEILVQCTPLAEGPSLIPEASIPAGTLVLDAVYRPLRTSLLEAAARRGARIATGADWFEHQAARQFELLTGRVAPAGVMREEIARALAEPRPIALVGLRGAGKSTLGRLLAAALAVELVDLDDATLALARERGIAADSVGDLLASRGLAEFRALESEALRATLALARPQVLATGGGVIEDPANRVLLRSRADCIWLDADPAVLAERVDRDPKSRPALVPGGSLAEARELSRRREPWYREVARLRLDSGRETPASLLVLVLAAIEAWEAGGKSRDPGTCSPLELGMGPARG